MTQTSNLPQRIKTARKLALGRKGRGVIVGRSDLTHFGMTARRDKDRNQNDRVHTFPSITGIRRSERVLGRPPTLPSHSTPSVISSLKNRRRDEERASLPHQTLVRKFSQVTLRCFRIRNAWENCDAKTIGECRRKKNPRRWGARVKSRTVFGPARERIPKRCSNPSRNEAPEETIQPHRETDS